MSDEENSHQRGGFEDGGLRDGAVSGNFLMMEDRVTSRDAESDSLNGAMERLRANLAPEEFRQLTDLLIKGAGGGTGLPKPAQKESIERGLRRHYDADAWREYVVNSRDVGMFTLAAMDPSPYSDRCRWVTGPQLLMYLVIFVQLVVPISVVHSEILKYDQGLCPNNANIFERAVAMSIGAIYVIRLTFQYSKKMRDSEDDDIPLRRNEHNPGKLLFYVTADEFMDKVYEGVVYLLNLWVVFIETSDVISMIFNALALEFILQMDNEVKELYLDVFVFDAHFLEKYRDANNDFGTRPITKYQKVVVSIIRSINNWGALICLVAVYAAFIYLPICKAGVE